MAKKSFKEMIIGSPKDKTGDADNSKSNSKKKKKPVRKMSKKEFRDQFPVIMRLNVSDSVVSTVIDDLKSIENDSNQRGAVRKVDGGFLVVMVSEEQLEEAGFTNKNRDKNTGRLTAGFTKKQITSVSLISDIQKGYVAFAPDVTTLSYLHDIDIISQVRFQLGIFPDIEDQDEDDVDELSIIPLYYSGGNGSDGLISFGALDEISSNDKEFHVDMDAKTIISEDEYESLAEEKEEDNPAGDMSDGGTLSQQSDDEDDLVDDDDDESDIFDDLEDEDVPELDEDDEAPEDDEPQLEDDSEFDEENSFAEDDVPDLSQVDDSEDEDEGDPKEYSDDIVNKVNEPIKLTNDFDLQADTGEVESLFDNIQLPQVKLSDEKANLLQEHFNVSRQAFNDKLRSISNEKRVELVSNYREALTSLISEVNSQVSIDGDEFKSRLDEINSNLSESKKESKDEIDARLADMEDDYARRKQEKVEAASKQAASSFDERHRVEYEQARRQTEMDLSNRGLVQYNQDMINLQDARKEKAQLLFNEGKAKILSNLSSNLSDFTSDVQNQFNDFLKQVEVNIKLHWDEETKRQSDEAYAENKDSKIKSLSDELKQLESDSNEKILAIQNESTESLRKKQEEADNRVAELQSRLEQSRIDADRRVSNVTETSNSQHEADARRIESLQGEIDRQNKQNDAYYSRFSVNNRNRVVIEIVIVALVAIVMFGIGFMIHNNGSSSSNTNSGQPNISVYTPQGQNNSNQSDKTQSSDDSNSDANNEKSDTENSNVNNKKSNTDKTSEKSQNNTNDNK